DQTISEGENVKNEGPSKEIVTKVEMVKDEELSTEIVNAVQMGKDEELLMSSSNDRSVDDVATNEKLLVENAQLSMEDQNIGNLEKSLKKDNDEIGDLEKCLIENVANFSKDVKSIGTD
ncbi:Hypothetical predicted protein, partial [Olea europaea subsp. europaea]